jgi:hypothetical protein
MVCGGAGEAFAVGAESHALDRGGVPREGAGPLARLGCAFTGRGWQPFGCSNRSRR